VFVYRSFYAMRIPEDRRHQVNVHGLRLLPSQGGLTGRLFFAPVLRFAAPAFSLGSPAWPPFTRFPVLRPRAISGPRGPTYQVATRELSADFAGVGPEHEALDLGSVDGPQFLKLLEQLVAIEAIKLVDTDPQLIVTVKSGRFLIQPQSGKLLVRPVNALDQVFFRFAPAEIPPFLDGAPPRLRKRLRR